MKNRIPSWAPRAAFVVVAALLSALSCDVVFGDVALPAVNLRGYGALSATYRLIPSTPGGSSLEIDCDNIAKAQVFLAKYLSDLSCLPGVSDAVLPTKLTIAAHLVNGQGAIAAVRLGVKVYVLTAADLSGLAVVARGALPVAAGAVSAPEVSVPMFLDRWDKFGFRFYYYSWWDSGRPPGPYNVDNEFQWAQKMDRSGTVFWDEPNLLDAAHEMNNEVWWDWSEKASKKYMLPTAINDTMFNDLNRYRDQQEWKMPQYVGDEYTIAGQNIAGLGWLSWNATTAADEGLALDQETIRDFKDDPNIVSYLEPHGEVDHGPQEILQEYGPAADSGFRHYLQETYHSLMAIGQRWYADPAHFKSWSEIRVPELASFLGWGPGALDLTGVWRIAYEPFTGKQPGDWELLNYGNRRVEGTTPAPDDWYRSGFDDSSWATLEAPGNDAMMFLPKRPAVFRRMFDVPASWRASHPKLYLYVWDLSLGYGDTVRAFLNDTELAASPVQFNWPHWAAWDVSDNLKAGSNFLAMRMPKGYIAYRAYLSPDPPVQYPNLGVQKNARWVDFAKWETWCRAGQVKRGVEMIRQVDANRNITLASPDAIADSAKILAETYGAEFHNTGYMAAFYADLLPLLMNGSDLPCSTEPGGPASNVQEYKKFMGLWYSEGVQSVDYFLHIGDVLWHDDIRTYFEQTQHKAHLFGKYHAAKAKVAVFYSYHANATNTFPWGADPNVNLMGGYWNWNIGANLIDRCDRDGVSDADFADGNVDAYKVVIDTNSSVVDDALLSQIERYVRNGGVFVTYVQTGRHTYLQPDAWPIARLTGYKVTHIDKLGPDKQPAERRRLKVAPEQTIYDAAALATMNAVPANGLSLQKVAADSHDLLLWSDGTVAAGYRKLGKGYIVQLGCKFTGASSFDRIEPGGNNGQAKALTMLVSKLMDWRGIPALLGHLTQDNEWIRLKHYVSNNSLYDVWTLWNQDTKNTQTVSLHIAEKPTVAYDVDTWQTVPLTAADRGAALKDIAIGPGETRIFLTARMRLPDAALDWFALQRRWWRGTTAPTSSALPPAPHRLTCDLSKHWSWRALSERDDPAALAKSTQAALGGESMRIGIWSEPDHLDVKHGAFMKTFAVPKSWTTGRISLWLQAWSGGTFADKGRVWLDGAVVRDWNPAGIAGDDFEGKLAPGTSHTIMVEIRGDGSLAGSRGTCWLAWKPAPLRSIDLAGQWTPSSDMLRYGSPVMLPGPYKSFSLRRSIAIPDAFAGKTIVFSANAPRPMVGVLVNGHWVRRHHHMIGENWSLNITPWTKPGAVNTIEMVCWDGPGSGSVKAVCLEAYYPGVFP